MDNQFLYLICIFLFYGMLDVYAMLVMNTCTTLVYKWRADGQELGLKGFKKGEPTQGKILRFEFG
jgi:hypothetical protein